MPQAENVLLGADLSARVADYGLTRAVAAGATTDGVQTAVAGTFGCFAPETLYGAFSIKARDAGCHTPWAHATSGMQTNSK